ncbi:MAG: hypothetical protein HYU74_13255 [Dechloromonas sp.]|nr:hypothetical protein [Dechloromonas sp.]
MEKTNEFDSGTSALNSGVIVRVARLPKNIGEMMNKLLSGELNAMHVVAVTRAGQVVRTSTGDIPEFVKINDSF